MSSILVAETLTKTSGESIAYAFDFTKAGWTSGETISSVTSVTATGDGTALTIGSPTHDSNRTVTVRISAGQSGYSYRVKCTVATSLSNTRIGLGNLDVNDGDDV